MKGKMAKQGIIFENLKEAFCIGNVNEIWMCWKKT